MALWQWSTTPANNASAGAIDWAEGQPPSTVNDSARQMMADVATWFASPEWLNYGLTPTYVSATQFTLAGNQTGIYSPARRVRASVSAGVIYGVVTNSAFTSLTTVNVLWDSGSLDSGLSEVDVGIMNPSNSSFPQGAQGIFSQLTVNDPSSFSPTTVIVNAANDANGANIKLGGNGSTTPNKTIRARIGQLEVVNSAYNAVIMIVDDSGNLTASGNITAQSDERLKTNWKPMPHNFIEHLAGLKRGTFSRTDTGQRQVGVGAQSLQVFLPEAVQGEESLSVAYGQAALVACAELAEEVLRLRALLEPVK